MGKKKQGILSIFSMGWIASELGLMILIGILGLGMVLFIAGSSLSKEYKQYGYNGFWDDIQYDDWTGEIIPKAEIENYSNDEKYITNSKGEQVTFEQIKEQMNLFQETTEGKTWIGEEQVETVESICNTLFREYLEIEYEIKPTSKKHSESYYIQLSEEREDLEYHIISEFSELEWSVKELVKKLYKEQNGLE